jgi:hypothetical protein
MNLGIVVISFGITDSDVSWLLSNAVVSDIIHFDSSVVVSSNVDSNSVVSFSEVTNSDDISSV